jgi:L-malate glycosyltransferase
MSKPLSASHRPLRVLHVISGDLWAGAESQFLQLVTALHDRPQVDVRAAIMNPGILADRLGAHGVQTDVFDERRQRTLQIARRLCAIAREWRPDIIHTHRRKEHIVGGIAALASRAHAIATIHGLSEFSHPWWRLRQTLHASLERLVLTIVYRRVVAVSEEMVDRLPYQRRKIIVIPNAIDVDAIRKAGQERRPELPGAIGARIAFIGRLEPVKRVERIVDTLVALNAARPGGWSLFIIGDGSRRPAIEAHISACDMQDHAHILGFIPNPLPILARMDALVFASEHEGLPMTALEALALGVPVVSPPLGGLTALVRESRVGGLASSAEPYALATAVQSALAPFDPADGCRASAVPVRYTLARSANAHLAMYQKVRGKHTYSIIGEE